MVSYSDKLKSPKWQKKRLEILQRDEFKCTKCFNDEIELNVHHKKYIFGLNPWEYENDNLTTLCIKCHKNQHDKNKIDFNKSLRHIPNSSMMTIKEALTRKI